MGAAEWNYIFPSFVGQKWRNHREIQFVQSNRTEKMLARIDEINPREENEQKSQEK